MGEDLLDDGEVPNAGDDPHRPAAGQADFNFFPENSLLSLGMSAPVTGCATFTSLKD